MSDQAKAARAAMKAKVKRLVSGEPHAKVDASSWTPPEMMNTEAKTGMRPVSPRQYKRGGKVAMAHGKGAHHHAGRKPRAGGGSLTADSLINRDAKEANRQRAGGKAHVGGYADGGVPTKLLNMSGRTIGGGYVMKRGGKAGHPDEAEDRALVKKMVKHDALTGKKRGGRAHRRNGGGNYDRQNLQNAIDENAAIRRGQKVPSTLMGPAEGADENALEYLRQTGQDNFRGPATLMPGPETPMPPRKRGGKAPEKWIQKAIKHPGALHKALHVPEGENIPAKKLTKAAHSENPTMAKRARLAQTLKGMHKADGGAAHPAGCRCHKCMGGKAKAHGGHVAGNYEGGTRPTGGRIARASGGIIPKESLMGAGLQKHIDRAESDEHLARIKKSLQYHGMNVPKTFSDVEVDQRTPRASGGRTKGKTNIIIAINPHGAHADQGMMQQPGMPPMGRPPAQPVPVAPPMAGPPPGAMPPPGGMPPMPVPVPPGMQMPRKRGGRTIGINDEGGAGSGVGRLEKAGLA